MCQLTGLNILLPCQGDHTSLFAVFFCINFPNIKELVGSHGSVAQYRYGK